MKVLIVTLCLFGVSVAIPGGFSPVPIDNPEVVALTNQAVEYHNNFFNIPNYKKLLKVQSARSQVVAGLKYEITFVVGLTDCLKSNTDKSNCKLATNVTPEECTYTVLVKLMNEGSEVLNGVCKLATGLKFQDA